MIQLFQRVICEGLNTMMTNPEHSESYIKLTPEEKIAKHIEVIF